MSTDGVVSQIDLEGLPTTQKNIAMKMLKEESQSFSEDDNDIALNRKTIQDRHPLPKIQDTLDNLSGNSWFSVLDQAHQQRFSVSWRLHFQTLETNSASRIYMTLSSSVEHLKNTWSMSVEYCSDCEKMA
eukprot:gene14614-16128_t